MAAIQTESTVRSLKPVVSAGSLPERVLEQYRMDNCANRAALLRGRPSRALGEDLH